MCLRARKSRAVGMSDCVPTSGEDGTVMNAFYTRRGTQEHYSVIVRELRCEVAG